MGYWPSIRREATSEEPERKKTWLRALLTISVTGSSEPANALGTKLPAKNAWGMKTQMDLTGKSLYELITNNQTDNTKEK